MNDQSDPLDQKLNTLLGTSETVISPDRIRRVRTSILVAAHQAGRRSLLQMWAGFIGIRPAMLVATGLLGLYLGASLPTLSLDDSGSSAFLEFHPQGFLTGDLG